MLTDWRNDIRKLIEKVAKHLNLCIIKKSLTVGAGAAAASFGFGMIFGPYGYVAGMLYFRKTEL